MKILLLGATGRTGKLVLRNLLTSGFHVYMLTQTTLTISRTDTAAFIAAQVGEEKYLNQAVTISSD